MTAFADPERVRQALENLLGNAVEHADEGTPIVVSVASEVRPDGPWALVGVSNEGPAVPVGLGAGPFTAFSPGGGSLGVGLGLYIAGRIAAVHGGELSVGSGSRGSVCFQLSLPSGELPAPDEGRPTAQPP